MSNYTQTTAFTPKDSLVSGNPAKIIKGSEFDAEFAAISAAIATKFDTANATAATIAYTPAGTGAVATTVQTKLREFVSVKDFGAVGNGVADDTSSVQAAINYLRNVAEAVPNQSGCLTLDFQGAVCKVTSSIDATGIATWGWAIQNGTLVGACTGKAVLDMTSSRGGRLSNFVVYGDKVNTPRVGIQSARATGTGQDAFCDNMYFENVSVNGYFSLSAAYFYGQETTTHINCQYWNSNPDGYAGIHSGYDFETYQSDYKTTITGGTSYINDKYVNCDWRYLPVDNTADITGITKANPCVISFASHPFSTGQTVVIGYVSGMTQINNVSAVIASTTSTSITLTGVDSTAWGTYTSGGSVSRAQTKPTVLFGRAEQHSFDTCYVVNYGSDSVEWKFESSQINAPSITFDMLFEGVGSRSHVRFSTGGASITPTITGFVFKTYNTHARDYIFSTDSGASGALAFYQSIISVSNNAVSAPSLVDSISEYAFYGANILVPVRSQFTPPAHSTTFQGEVTAVSDGVALLWASSLIDGAFTPTVSAVSGSITAYTATGYAKRIGSLVFVSLEVTITNNGTGATSLTISGLPVAALSGTQYAMLSGREVALTGISLSGAITPGSGTLSVFKADNSYPGGTGAILRMSGCYIANT